MVFRRKLLMLTAGVCSAPARVAFSCPVAFWGDAVTALELPVEIAQIIKSAVPCYFQNRIITAAQPFRSGTQAALIDKGDETFPCHFLEPAHKMAGAQPAAGCSLRHRNRSGRVLFQQREHLFQPPCVRRVCGKGPGLILHQQGQKYRQRAADRKLKAGRTPAAGGFGGIQAGGGLVIVVMAGTQQHRQGQPPRLQRQQDGLGTQILRPDQHLKGKNDVFVLHFTAGHAVQRVERPRHKNKNIPRPRLVQRHTGLHAACPLLDEHQLHAVLPMQAHLREILRDGAGIQIEGKPRVPMALGFPIGMFRHGSPLRDRIVP